MNQLRYVQINVLHPSDSYFAHHRLKRFNDVPAEKPGARGEVDRLVVGAIGPVSGACDFSIRCLLGSMVRDTTPCAEFWPPRKSLHYYLARRVTYPTIPTVLAIAKGARGLYVVISN
jgi:hypothetical protein